MPELFDVTPPAEALRRLLRSLPDPRAALSDPRAAAAAGTCGRSETVPTEQALGRVLAASLTAPESLPGFRRSTMDGYAVRAEDTYGATEALPAYLSVVGELAMGAEAGLDIGVCQAAVIHTGGMLPPDADAVVMVERTQKLDEGAIEVLRAAAPGENVIQVGEDIREGDPVLPAGHVLRPQDIGGLMALGVVDVPTAPPPKVAILSTGDEVVPPEQHPGPGCVRDVNSHTVSGLVARAGGLPVRLGIAPDRFEVILERAQEGLREADALVISAGSSVSMRDLTARVVDALGSPGVLVHGVSVRPGKPTILGVCGGKPVVGLPGNPVSAFVVSRLFVVPLVLFLQGAGTRPDPFRRLAARAGANIPSVPGREDYVPVRLERGEGGSPTAHPVFGKSNLIYTLVHAEGLLRVPLDAGGLQQGQEAEVELF